MDQVAGIRSSAVSLPIGSTSNMHVLRLSRLGSDDGSARWHSKGKSIIGEADTLTRSGGFPVLLARDPLGDQVIEHRQSNGSGRHQRVMEVTNAKIVAYLVFGAGA